MEKAGDTIKIALPKDEALVLFKWLARLDETQNGPPIDSAEQKVLWNLEAQLEGTLIEIVKPDCRELLAEAKKRLSC